MAVVTVEPKTIDGVRLNKEFTKRYFRLTIWMPLNPFGKWSIGIIKLSNKEALELEKGDKK